MREGVKTGAQASEAEEGSSSPEARVGQTTRRQFLTYGAVGLATAGAAGAGLLRWGNRGATAGAGTAGPRHIDLDITHRIETMVDGTQLFTWMYLPRQGKAGPFPDGATLPTRTLDDGTMATYQVLRHHWASVFPERVIPVLAGETLEITLTNNLGEPHNFAIREEDVELPKYFDTGALPPGQSTTFTLPPLPPGTYIFEDDLDTLPEFWNTPEDHGGVCRSLGLHGVLIVSPPDPWTVVSGPPNMPLLPAPGGEAVEFERQYVWVFNDHDPAWNALAQAGRAREIDMATHIPRYFTINGRSGVDCAAGPGAGLDTRPCGMLRDPHSEPGQLIRAVNVGIEIHGMHIHGNHVQVLKGAPPFRFKLEDPVEFVPHLAFKDVVPLHPRDRYDLLLPCELPRDAATTVAPRQQLHYPMHSHSEPSQTAGGGLYPGGQLTDWILLT